MRWIERDFLAGKAKWLFKPLLIARFISIGEDSPVCDVRAVLPEKNIKRHWSSRPAFIVRTGTTPKHLLLKELEFFPAALEKILKRMLITVVTTLRHCHFRELFGVLASHTPWEKGFLCCYIAPCQCSRRVPDGSRELSSHAGTAVCGGIVTWGVSGTEMEAAASTEESLGEQFSWTLSSQEGLLHPVLWKKHRHQKMREKPNIYNKDDVQESRGNLYSLLVISL